MLKLREIPEPPGDARIRERYLDAMEPLFFPEKPQLPDIKQYVCSLLRAGGIEDCGWDPFSESQKMIFDLFKMMKIEFSEEEFDEPKLVTWRLGLLFYSQIIEMNAPYEVLANLLRYRLGLGFSFIPFDEFLEKQEIKPSKRNGLFPHQKIRVLSELGDRAGLPIRNMFSEFYRRDLRNAIAHSDFIFVEHGFRCRGIINGGSFEISFEELDNILNRAKVFAHVFFSLERQAREFFGAMSDRFWGYDPTYKGIFEFLASGDGLLEGFKVHWPNGSDSYYRRSESGNDCVNCIITSKPPGLDMMVGLYARQPSEFSPLVEQGKSARYTPIEKSGEVPRWRDD